jgi:transposase
MFKIMVGVDVAKKKFEVARWCDGKYRQKVFENNSIGFAALLTWWVAFGNEPVLFVMEATGADSLPLAQFLADQGLAVSVVNPAQIKALAQSELSRTKADPADARLIARYGQERQPPRWTPPSPIIRELQALVRRVEPLLEMRQMEQNRLDTADDAAASSIQNLLKTLDQELKETRDKIHQRINDDPDLQPRRDLLESIPGIGEATVAHLLILLSAHHGFQNAKQAAAFAGLAPNPHQSGEKGKTRLAKIGDPLLRKILYMPALVAKQHHPLMAAFCERLKANGLNGKAVVCAAMRKLIHIAFGVLKSQRPFDPNFTLA